MGVNTVTSPPVPTKDLPLNYRTKDLNFPVNAKMDSKTMGS